MIVLKLVSSRCVCVCQNCYSIHVLCFMLASFQGRSQRVASFHTHTHTHTATSFRGILAGLFWPSSTELLVRPQVSEEAAALRRRGEFLEVRQEWKGLPFPYHFQVSFVVRAFFISN